MPQARSVPLRHILLAALAAAALCGAAAQPAAPVRAETQLVVSANPYASDAGRRILRAGGGKTQQFGVRLKDLVRGGDLSANVAMRPGDVLIIPQSLF